MKPSLVWLALVSVLVMLQTSCGKSPKNSNEPQRLGNACASAPAIPKSFYEDNPTYTSVSAELIWPTGTPESQGMNSERLAEGVAKFAETPQSLSLLVIRNGVVVREEYFHGSLSTDSNNIHSASKSIIGLLVGIAIREGYLRDLDVSIEKYLSPKFRVGPKQRKITVRHLLNMTAGFSWKEDDTEYSIEQESSWVQAILNLRVTHTPGKTFHYNTGLTHLLSAILTESSAISACTLAQRFLFGPMGIPLEHWGSDPEAYSSGGYNVYLTPRSLAKIAHLFLQNGMWNGREIVPSDWMVKMSTHWVEPTDQPDARYAYGHLLWLPPLASHPVYKMWGYGGQYVYVVPSLGLVAVVTSDTKQTYPEMNGDTFFSEYILGSVR